MNWCNVIFVLIVVNPLDSVQIEGAVNETITGNYLNLHNNSSLCNSLKAQVCSNDEKIQLNIKSNFQESFQIQSIDNRCYYFEQENETFVANFYKLNDSMFCGVVENPSPLYFLSDNFSNFIKRCPEETEICLNPACPLQDFKIEPKIEKSYINLYLTWKKINLHSTIKLLRENNSHECYAPNLPLFNYSLMNNTLIIPNKITEFEVNPGCSYDIYFFHDNQEKEKIACYYNYTVPECVENKCDCKKFKPNAKISSVEHISEDRFSVTWNPGVQSSEKNYTIKKIAFKYTEGNSIKSAVLISSNFKNHVSEIEMKLFDDGNYTLLGIFENNVSCFNTDEYLFKAPLKRSGYGYAIILVIVFIVVVLFVVIEHGRILKYIKKVRTFMYLRRRYTTSELPALQNGQIQMRLNIQYTPMEFTEGRFDEFEFPRNKIIMKEVIGSGAFGQVHCAKAIGIGGIEGWKMVAVKTLGGENITPEATNDFFAEIEIFKKIGKHPNIVELLGCCTIETPYMMIMEFVPCGDLKKYLLELREQWLKKRNILNKHKQVFFPDNSDGAYILSSDPATPVSITSSRLPSTSDTISTSLEESLTPLTAHYSQALDRILDHTELQNFALQIARGMAHLEKICVTHRDLAARNILINEYKTLKISDFGLSRTGPYINHKVKKLPLRWMALEAIVEQKYDSKSDVWSFGVVLWEIGTLGASPYESVPDSFVKQFLQIGRRLERPEICTDELYLLMKQCWAADPNERPSFHELVDALDVKKRKIYVNFSQLNPTYVFPPSEIKNCSVTPVKSVNIHLENK